MAKGRRNTPSYETRVVTPPQPATQDVQPAYKPGGWTKKGIVIKTMYHAYSLPGKIGDVVDVDNDKYDELIKKGFIKEI
jgi:hypothetical protein